MLLFVDNILLQEYILIEKRTGQKGIGMMQIYHGSQRIIRKPLYGGGKPYNDYGQGFYCTAMPEMAKEWAVEKDRSGFANVYDLDLNALKILNLNDNPYCILHWLAVLLENRQFDARSPIAAEAKEYILAHFRVNYQKADVMIGYRADDSYFSFAQDFLNNTISYRQLNRAMHLGNMGEQIVLKSKKAFTHITYQGFELAESSIWYPKKKERDDTARSNYYDVRNNKRQKGDLFISQIIDERMKENDLCL